MKKEIIYVDEALRMKFERNTNTALSRIKRVIPILKGLEVPITKDVVLECIDMMRRETLVPVDTEEQAHMADNMVRMRLCRTDIKYVNCDTINEAIERTKERMAMAEPTQARKQAVISEFEGRANAELAKIVDIMYGDIDYTAFRELVVVNAEGEPQLDENRRDGVYVELATIYAEGKKALEAMNLHKQASEALNRFFSSFNGKVQPRNLNVFFRCSNDKISEVPFDYNSYLD